MQVEMTQTDSLAYPPLRPPRKVTLKDGLFITLELIYFFIIFVPLNLSLHIFKIFFYMIFPQEKSLKGQVVIVTGGGRGLGRGLALALAREGAKVAVVDLDRDSASRTARDIADAGGIAKPYFTNVARTDEIRQLRLNVLKDLGPVDILINNAGLVYLEVFDSMTEAAVRTVMDVNLLSHIWMVQEFLPDMKSRNSGHIVAMCSMSAITEVRSHGSVYTASKYAVKGFMNSLRIDLDLNPKNNIKTTTVLPYYILTNDQYINQWDLRIPALSVDEVVKATITGIKREEIMFSVPRYMYASLIFKLFHPLFEDKFYSILYMRIKLPNRKDKDSLPAHQIISQHSK